MRESRIASMIKGFVLSFCLVGVFCLVLSRIKEFEFVQGFIGYVPIVFSIILLGIVFGYSLYLNDENRALSSDFRRMKVTHEVSKKDLLYLYPYNLIWDIHKVTSYGRINDEDFLYRIYVPGVLDSIESKLSMQERDIVRLKYRYNLHDSKISEMRSISKSEIHTILKNSYYKIRNVSENYISASNRERENMKARLEESERKLRVLIAEKGTKNLRIYTSKFPIAMLNLSDYVKDGILKSGIQYVEELGDMSVDELVNLTHLDTNGVVELAYQLNRVGIMLKNSRILNDSSNVQDSAKIVSL